MSRVESFESRLQSESGDRAASVLDALEATLRETQDFHRLFDARLMRVRHEMGLPVVRPTSLRNIPEDKDAAFREAYIAAARDVGRHLLEAGKLTDAWVYFRTIGEPGPVREAIDRISIPSEPNEEFDAILNLALYEGAHYVRGLEFLLKTHGTCNTVTALSQLIGQLTPAERRQAAAMLVRTVYSDLKANLRRDLEAKQPLLDPDPSVIQMIATREFLFADGNYHIDVSHLHSTVGFARHLHPEDPELKLAIELAQYGSRLSDQLRYPADVPFDDYYTANLNFLKAIAGRDVDSSLDYFQQRLRAEPDESDRRLIAFVLVDLAQRVGKAGQVLQDAGPYVSRMEDANGFSFTAFCADNGNVPYLEQAARANDDVLALATALLLRSE